MPEITASRQSEIDKENPWPGLDPYTELSHDFFHGRDAELIELEQRVRADRLTVLFGQSGLGKTSLLQAGLFPRLRALDFLPVYCRLEFDRDAQPVEQVKWLFAENTSAHRIETRPFAPRESLWGYFQSRDTELWNQWNRLVTP